MQFKDHKNRNEDRKGSKESRYNFTDTVFNLPEISLTQTRLGLGELEEKWNIFKPPKTS